MTGLFGDSERGDGHYFWMWEPFWNNCIDSHCEDFKGATVVWV